MIAEKTRKKHVDADVWREEVVSNTILLAAASQSRQGSMSLPVRRRDSETDASSASSSRIVNMTVVSTFRLP